MKIEDIRRNWRKSQLNIITIASLSIIIDFDKNAHRTTKKFFHLEIIL